MMGSQQKHMIYLNNLVDSLEQIGESKVKLTSIIIEPIWFYEERLEQHKLCDIVLIYRDRMIPAELKGSINKRHKAIEQLYYGRLYINEVLKCGNVPYGLFVVYGHNRYKHERIPFTNGLSSVVCEIV